MTSRSVVLVAVLALSFLAAPLAADAQQAAKVPRIGFLVTNLAGGPHTHEAFRQGLRDPGYVEGRNLVIEYRDAEGKLDRLPALAAELHVNPSLDVVIAWRKTLGETAMQKLMWENAARFLRLASTPWPAR